MRGVKGATPDCIDTSFVTEGTTDVYGQVKVKSAYEPSGPSGLRLSPVTVA